VFSDRSSHDYRKKASLSTPTHLCRKSYAKSYDLSLELTTDDQDLENQKDLKWIILVSFTAMAILLLYNPFTGLYT